MNKNLPELLQKDQSNIGLYRKGEITKEELITRNKEISVEFQDLIKNNGFPTKKDGEEIYLASIGLTLHSGKNFLQYVYELIKDLDESLFDKKHKAYIIDRILVLDDKPQLYGTQFKELQNGEKELFPIQDPENLKLKREEMNLDKVIVY